MTSSCLFSSLPYQVVNCSSVLHHFKQEISQLFPHLKISVSLHTLLELLLNIKGSHDVTKRKLIVFLRIVMWHIIVNSLARSYMIRVWLRSCDVRISTPNFKTSSHQNVTANKRIGTSASCMLSWPDLKAVRD